MRRYQGVIAWTESGDGVQDQDAFVVETNTQMELVQQIMTAYGLNETPWKELKVEITDESDVSAE